MGKVVGVVSLKGGVGKTTSVVSLAYSLVKNFGKKVLVVDGNLTAPNLGLHVGVADPEYTIHDVLENRCLVSEAVYDHEYGFSIMAGSLRSGVVGSKQFRNKMSGIKKYFDIVLIDTTPALNSELAHIMGSCDELYCVSTPDYPTLAATLRAVNHGKENGWNFCGIILNMKSGSYDLKAVDIEKATGVKVVGEIREDIKVAKALASVKPIGMFKPYSSVSLGYNSIAASVTDEEYRKPGFFARLFGNLQ